MSIKGCKIVSVVLSSQLLRGRNFGPLLLHENGINKYIVVPNLRNIMLVNYVCVPHKISLVLGFDPPQICNFGSKNWST